MKIISQLPKLKRWEIKLIICLVILAIILNFVYRASFEVGVICFAVLTTLNTITSLAAWLKHEDHE